MSNDDSQFENYLAEFQPRPVGKLKIPRQPSKIWLRYVAAAAVLALGAGASLWFTFRKNVPGPETAVMESPEATSSAPPKQLGPIALTRLALDDSREFDLYLLNQSRTVLPDLGSEQSSLRILVTE